MININKIITYDRLKVIVIALILIALFVPSFLFEAQDTKSEIDGSYIYAFSRIKALTPPLTIGKDIGFTYGPLSFILGSVLPHSSFDLNLYLIRTLISLFIMIMTIYSVCLFAQKAAGWRYWMLVLIAALYPGVPWIDATWTGLGLLLSAIAVMPIFEAKQRNIAVISLAVLSPLALMLKFSIGFHIFALLSAALVINCFSKKEFKLMGLAAIIFSAALFSLWFMLTRAGLGGLISYLLQGAQTSALFSEFATKDYPFLYNNSIYLQPLILVSLMLFLAFKIGGSEVTLVFLCSFFFLYKYGFVRADGHMMPFFQNQWAMFLIVLSAASSGQIKKWTNGFLTFALILWLIAYQGASSWFVAPNSMFTPQDRLIQGITDLPKLFAPKADFLAARETSRANFLGLEGRYPALFKKLNAQCGPRDTIAILPWQLMFSELVNAKWRPLPTLQLYTSEQMPGFAQKDKDFFDNNGPSRVLLESKDSIDWRSPIAEASHIIPELLENYRVADTDKTFLILKRTGFRSKIVYRPFNPTQPYVSNLLFIKAVGIKRQPWFAAQTLLFKGPQFYMEISLNNGKAEKWHVYASQLEGGMFIGLPGVTLKDLFGPNMNAPVKHKLSIRLIPERFTGLSMDISPMIKISTCRLIAD